ncbi:MAG: Biopolymer transport protein ExbD [Syntrophorhabdaceae bacterium PtaU1.Bin034]|jgi:biopolymer transport protein ExbD|nr:MAG: Biopolymer transport protein ExbD [Syntrophorhabdaceae bacterium PtaU1.Bin034]
MDEKGFDYMNVIPLVDIMLVLLTIVLMTSTFVASGAIPVQLPKVSQTPNQSPLKAATVTIDRQGAIYFESVPTTLSGLQQHLKNIGHETPVAVKADRSVTVQACVDVLDLLSGNGFKKVSLQTERSQ